MINIPGIGFYLTEALTYPRRKGCIPERLGNVDGLVLHGGVEYLVGVLRPVGVVDVLPGARPQPFPVVEGQHSVGLHLHAAEQTRPRERDLKKCRVMNAPSVKSSDNLCTYPGALALDYPGLVGVRKEGVGGDVVVGGHLPLVEAPVGLGEERNLDPLVVNHRL